MNIPTPEFHKPEQSLLPQSCYSLQSERVIYIPYHYRITLHDEPNRSAIAQKCIRQGAQTMAFLNEYISEDNFEKYEIKKWNEKFSIGRADPEWTRDTERDLYLRYVSTGHDGDDNDKWTFCFYWKGVMLRVMVRVSGKQIKKDVYKKNYKLADLVLPNYAPLPNTLLMQRKEILADLKDALMAFGDFGLCSIWTKDMVFSFDF